MKNDQTHEELALIVTEHAPFGHILAPYILSTSQAPTFQMIEQASDTTLDNPAFSFSPDERELIRLLSKTTDQSLCKAFSREQNVRSFFAKLKQETIDRHIAPFLDRTFAKVLDLAQRTLTPIFLRSEGYSSVSEADRLAFPAKQPKTTFYFYLSPEGQLSYTLKILADNGEFQLYGKRLVELTAQPATIVVDRTIYRFANLQSSKFRPFTQKKNIVVPPDVVPKYMQTYVRQTIMSNYVRAYGFRVVKREESFCAILRLTENVIGYTFELEFAYGDKCYDYGRKNRTVDLEEKDGQYTFYTSQRQVEREQAIAEQLVELGLVQMTTNGFHPEDANPMDGAPFVRWCNDHRQALREMGVELEVSTKQSFYCGDVGLRVDMQSSNDWFDIEGSVILDGFEVPFMKLAKNIREHKAEYVLPDGRTFLLPEEWFTSWADVLQIAKANGDHLRVSKVHAALLPPDLKESLGEVQVLQPSDEERRGELHATLRPYQAEGFQWMNTLRLNNRGGILADDMGLGKTLQTIALLAHVYAPASPDAPSALFNQSGLPASLIVMPVSLLHNWASELQRFAPQLALYTYTANNRPRSSEVGRIFQHYHVVLTSYGILRNDAEHLAAYPFHYLILDESQYVKNPSSKAYHALQQLTATHRLTISGTPIENRLADLWAQMNIVNPGLLGSARFFRTHFELPIERQSDQLAHDRLLQLTQPFILRRTKEMVARDLPELTQQTILCDMTPEQRQCYDREKSASRNSLLQLTPDTLSEGREKFMALQALTRLRLIANHPALIDDDYEGQSGKTETVVDYIQRIADEGHKMLVFSAFVRDLDLLAHRLTLLGIPYSQLTGRTRNRPDVISHFSDDPSQRVFLISLKAGGVGLNLTSADYVLMLNPWWNPAAEAQAINRAHRIGQTHRVIVYRFLMRDTIEEKIAHLQAHKQALADNFVPTTQELVRLVVE